MKDSEIVFTTTPGSVSLLQATGSDNTYVNAAVVSDEYDAEIEPAAKHARLLEDMAKDGHWGCWHHISVTFKIECPIFVARQILRASGMHYNEISGRYKILEPKFYIPRAFHTDVKRVNLGTFPEEIEDQAPAVGIFKDSCTTSWNSYSSLLGMGIRKEQARQVLPLNVFTEFWMSGTLRYWLHFLNLRLDSHAQYETKKVAEMLFDDLNKKYPETIRLWTKYGKGPINEFGTIQTP